VYAYIFKAPYGLVLLVTGYHTNTFKLYY